MTTCYKARQGLRLSAFYRESGAKGGRSGEVSIIEAELLYQLHDRGYDLLSRQKLIQEAKNQGQENIPVHLVVVNQSLDEAERELEVEKEIFYDLVAAYIRLQLPELDQTSKEFKLKVALEKRRILQEIKDIYKPEVVH